MVTEIVGTRSGAATRMPGSTTRVTRSLREAPAAAERLLAAEPAPRLKEIAKTPAATARKANAPPMTMAVFEDEDAAGRTEGIGYAAGAVDIETGGGMLDERVGTCASSGHEATGAAGA